MTTTDDLIPAIEAKLKEEPFAGPGKLVRLFVSASGDMSLLDDQDNVITAGIEAISALYPAVDWEAQREKLLLLLRESQKDESSGEQAVLMLDENALLPASRFGLEPPFKTAVFAFVGVPVKITWMNFKGAVVAREVCGFNPADGEIILKTDDHPEARGRQPLNGEQDYRLFFKGEDGSKITIAMGKQSLAAFRNFVMSLDIDEAFEKIDNQSQAN